MSISGTQLLLVVLSLIALQCACSTSKPTLNEAPPSTQSSVTAPQLTLPKVIAPKLSEAQDAVKRIFKDAVVIDATANPSFFTGDFNGDSSQDLAVILKVSPGKTTTMNEEYPSWLLRDPFAKEGTSLKVKEDEQLLAIIHGYGDNDWRDTQATQTYLLKNAVGSEIEVQLLKDLPADRAGRRLPRAQGDLISETLRGSDGYLYYARATYLWFDPRNSGSVPNGGMVHRLQ